MKRIIKGNFIKHKNFMDVCLLVDKVRGPYGENQELEIKGVWWNQGYNQSWPLNMNAKIRIKCVDLKNWLICNDSNAVCLRNCEWI